MIWINIEISVEITDIGLMKQTCIAIVVMSGGNMESY
jgi:hypothetical protein